MELEQKSKEIMIVISLHNDKIKRYKVEPCDSVKPLCVDSIYLISDSGHVYLIAK